MPNLDEWAHEIHELAVAKGWWDGENRNFGEVISNIHGELSESFESYRRSEPARYYVQDKPEGWAVELADVLIRTLDMLDTQDISIEELVREKHEYNKTRAYRHGGLRA